MKEKLHRFGNTSLNEKELEFISNQAASAIQRQKDTLLTQKTPPKRLADRKEWWKTRRSLFCYQINSSCSCPVCSVFFSVVERLELTQHSTLQFAEKLASLCQQWQAYRIMDFLSHGLRLQRGPTSYRMVFDVNAIPFNYVVEQSVKSYWINSDVFMNWTGDFNQAKDMLLDRACVRRGKHIAGYCRLLRVLAMVMSSQGKTVLIPVDEIRRRMGSKRFGDLILMVKRIGIEYVKPDEEFEAILGVKIGYSRSKRTRDIGESVVRAYRKHSTPHSSSTA